MIAQHRVIVSPARGKSAVLWSLLFFCAVQAWLECFLQSDAVVRDPSYGLRLRSLQEAQARYPRRPLLLLLGSSHVAGAVRPDMLGALRDEAGQEVLVFNFGEAAAASAHELLFLQRLLSDGVAPRWVAIECWPAIMTDNWEKHEVDLHLDIRRLSWSDAGTMAPYSRQGTLMRRWWQANFMPWYGHRHDLLDRLDPRWIEPEPRAAPLLADGWGWAPLPLPGDNDAYVQERQIAHTYDVYAPGLRRFELSSVADGAVREMLQLCAREGVRTALLMMPEAPTVRGWYSAFSKQSVRQYFEQFHLPILDLRAWGEENDFSDGHHLRTPVVRAFSQQLGRQGLQPFVEGRLAPGFFAPTITAPLSGVPQAGAASRTGQAGATSLGAPSPTPTPQGGGSPPTAEPGRPRHKTRVAMVLEKGGRMHALDRLALDGLSRGATDLHLETNVLESSSEYWYDIHLKSLADANYDLVFAVGSAMTEAVNRLAPNYPNTQFVLVDGVVEQPNVQCLLFREEEGSFQAGALAGLLTRSDTVGFVGGMKILLIEKFEAGFRAGVRSVRSHAVVLSRYTDRLDDADAGQDAAQHLLSQGADVLYHVCGACGNGVRAAAPPRRVYSIASGYGEDADLRDVAGLEKRADQAVQFSLREFLSGKMRGGRHVFGTAEDGVGLSLAADVPQHVREKLDRLRGMVTEGRIVVPVTLEQERLFQPPRL